MWLVYAWRVLTGRRRPECAAKLAEAVPAADRHGPVERAGMPCVAGLLRLSPRTVMPFLLSANSQYAAFSCLRIADDAASA